MNEKDLQRVFSYSIYRGGSKIYSDKADKGVVDIDNESQRKSLDIFHSKR